MSGATAAVRDEVAAIARAAGEAVLAVYRGEIAVDVKDDGSPLTEADRRAEEIILARLDRVAPGTPIVSEESWDGRQAEGRGAAGAFWLVDPLDGTKEFVKRTDEFTVNIALIEAGEPVLGVVLAPALGRLFAGARGGGAVLQEAGGTRPLAAREMPPEGATLVSSRSHGDPEALARFTAGRPIAASVGVGSSLKFCLLAAGEADIYPRLGRTMEWDTAAGDAVLRVAGGTVTDLDGQTLAYGKPGHENPHFVAYGRGHVAERGR